MITVPDGNLSFSGLTDVTRTIQSRYLGKSRQHCALIFFFFFFSFLILGQL